MTLRNYSKSSQKSLFAADDGGNDRSRWHDGATLDYLGKSLALKLDTDRRQAMREDAVLHLPLPPDATERQIQDAAESWLRREAEVLFSRLVENEIDSKSGRPARGKPTLSLSFALRGSWTKVDADVLRLNWRLIEQPLAVIELTLRRAVAMLASQQATADLF